MLERLLDSMPRRACLVRRDSCRTIASAMICAYASIASCHEVHRKQNQYNGAGFDGVNVDGDRNVSVELEPRPRMGL
jgi:hypothetical protein